MPKIQNYSKTRSQPPRWEHDDFPVEITIEKNASPHRKDEPLLNHRGNWVFRAKEKGGYELKKEFTDTKEQARRRAIQWMGKHPYANQTRIDPSNIEQEPTEDLKKRRHELDEKTPVLTQGQSAERDMIAEELARRSGDRQ